MNIGNSQRVSRGKMFSKRGNEGERKIERD